jgi:hypothetical protein
MVMLPEIVLADQDDCTVSGVIVTVGDETETKFPHPLRLYRIASATAWYRPTPSVGVVVINDMGGIP